MSVWRGSAMLIVVAAAVGCLLVHAPAERGASYNNVPRAAGDGWFRGVYELLAVRSLGTARGSEIKALWWRAAALLLLAVAAAAGTGRLLMRRRQAAAEWDRRPSVLPAHRSGRGPSVSRLRRAALLGLGAYLGLELLSCLWSDAPALSVAAAADRAFGVIWCLCIALLLRPGAARRVAAAVAGGTCLAALTAFGFRYGIRGAAAGALTFPMSNPNFLAAVLTPAILVCAAGVDWAVGFRGGRRSTRIATVTSGAVGAALLGTALWRTDCLGAWAGLFVAACLYAACRVRGWWKALPLAVCGTGLAALALWTVGTFGPVSDTGAHTGWGRWMHWRASVSILAQRPFFGHGPAAHVRKVQPISYYRHPIEFHAHNELLETASEVGIPGGLLLAGAWTTAIVAGFRCCDVRGRGAPGSAAGVAAGFVAMVSHQLVSQALRYPEVACIFWTWLGLLLASAGRGQLQNTAREGTQEARRQRPRTRWHDAVVLGVFLLALAGGGLVFQLALWPGYAVKMRSAELLAPSAPPAPWSGEFERGLAFDLSLLHRLELMHEQGRRLIELAERIRRRTTASLAQRGRMLTLAREAKRILLELDRVAPCFGRVRSLLSRASLLADEPSSLKALSTSPTQHIGKS